MADFDENVILNCILLIGMLISPGDIALSRMPQSLTDD